MPFYFKHFLREKHVAAQYTCIRQQIPTHMEKILKNDKSVMKAHDSITGSSM